MTAWTDLTPVAYSVDYVDAGGVPTRSLQAGDGRDVVFLHGTSGHLEAFMRNISRPRRAGYRCHAIDMLGHGYTGKPDYPYEIPATATTCSTTSTPPASSAPTSAASRSAVGSARGSRSRTPSG